MSFTSENQLAIIAGSRQIHVSIVATGDRPPFVVAGDLVGCSGFYWLRLDDELEVESWHRVPLEDEAEHSPRLRSRLRRSPDGTSWVFDVPEERFVLMRLSAPAGGR